MSSVARVTGRVVLVRPDQLGSSFSVTVGPPPDLFWFRCSRKPPKLGQNFTLGIKGFLPKPQFGQLILGVSNTKWGLIPLPMSLAVLGMNNCNLLVSLDSSSLIVTDTQGSFKTTMKVPSSPSLLGAKVYGQAWAPDPKSNALGVAMTSAFKVVVGN